MLAYAVMSPALGRFLPFHSTSVDLAVFHFLAAPIGFNHPLPQDSAFKSGPNPPRLPIAARSTTSDSGGLLTPLEKPSLSQARTVDTTTVCCIIHNVIATWCFPGELLQGESIRVAVKTVTTLANTMGKTTAVNSGANGRPLSLDHHNFMDFFPVFIFNFPTYLLPLGHCATQTKTENLLTKF